MIKKHKLIILLSLCLQFCYSQNLKLNLKKGHTYYQTTNTTSNIHQEINGEKIDMEMSIVGKMKFRVLERNKAYYEMEVAFKSLSMNLKSAFANVSMDSEDKSDTNIFSQLLRQMIDHNFYIKMNRNGSVKEVKINHVFDRLLDSFPEVPKAQKIQIIAQIKQAYGEKAFKGNIEMITAIFPNKNVKINDKWTNEIRLESGMGGTMANSFILKEMNKNYAIIDLNSKTITDDANAYISINGALTKYNLSGTMKSTIKVDSGSGWIISSDILQDIVGTVEIKEKEDSKEVLIIPMQFKSTMLVTGE